MGLKECQIELDNPWNTYYAGQIVNGRVNFTFDSPKKIRGITIRFLGESETSWTETEQKTDNEGKSYEDTTTLKGHEEYFQIQYYLVGGKNSSEIELPAGTHTYPFTCALPPTLPSSFEGQWGHVRYTIKVTLDRPWKFDQDTKMAFTVISPVDLNLNPRVKEPHKLEMEKSFCCFCCASGPLSVIVHVPVTGYVSGQTIPLTIECDNASNVHVNIIKISLKKLISFHTHTPRRDTKTDSADIASLAVGPVEPGKSNSWRQTIEIPPLPPSNLVNCGIIDLDYEILVDTEVTGMHTNLSGTIPVQLGTVPLASFQSPAPLESTIEMEPPTKPVSPENGQGGAMGWNIGDNQLYPNIPPPTFAEGGFKGTITDKSDNQYTQVVGTNEYAPRYPTYAFAPSAPTFN